MSALLAELRQIIALEGPLTVERYMALCLGHPRFGYYITRDPIGARGDFVTAPEISQMFGELIGLWAVETWRLMGAPAPFALVELGPGRGTLMADMLRAAKIVPSFLAAAEIHLVETSPVLRARQQAALAGAHPAVNWHESIEHLPDLPTLVIANEFFDALPVRQFVRGERGWHERLVGVSDEGMLCFGLAAQPTPEMVTPAPPGAVLEWPAAGLAMMDRLARQVAAQGGAVLAIDYGHVRSGFGDTLQAVRAHGYTDVLADPGEADLTTHVDFARLAQAAATAGAAVHGPTTQGAFLRALGIDVRARALATRTGPEAGTAIEAARLRLAGDGPAAMGGLFKVLAVAHPSVPPLPGF